jgi:hypothetical protein
MKLKNPLSIISTKFKEPSICESCGEEFICGATLKGCWCMNLKLTDEARNELKSKYNDCLCQTCLEKYEEKDF